MSQRILFINTVGKLGGAELSLLGLLAGLDRRQFQLGLVCPAASELEQQATALGIAVAGLPIVTSNLLSSPRAYLHSMANIGRLIAAWRPDLIHGNGVRSAHYAVPLGRLMRIPTLLHIRDIALPPSRLTRLLLCQADAQIAISSAVAATLSRQRLCARHCAVVYNGIDLVSFAAAAPLRTVTRTSLGLEAHQLAVGLVGRLLPWKGQHMLIEAAHLLRDLPELHWLIIGEEWNDSIQSTDTSGYRQQLENRITELGLADRITLVGRRDDIPAVMASLDLVLVPSLDPEPFGRVVIEAMAAGKPVIVSDAGGLTEIVPEGVVGYRVPPGNATAIASHVRVLAGQPDLRCKLGSHGLAHVQSHFSLQAYVDGVSQIYSLLLN